MITTRSVGARRRAATTTVAFLAAVVVFFCAACAGSAHPLGNFTINHFTRLELDGDRVSIRYVVDMAEISTFQELQTADTNADGSTSSAELDAYLERVAPEYRDRLLLTIDGAGVPLRIVARKVSLPPGAGGLPTLRAEFDYAGELGGAASASRRLRFEDTNHQGRPGWHEIVVAPRSGISVFDSSAYGNGVTDELKAYPQDMLAVPLDERIAELSFAGSAAIPAGASSLMTRDGRPVVPARDMFAELIAVPELTPLAALVGLFIAAALGAFHALSPGHGKTVVGAYLVGSRGTPRHAAFLGLTVTITHTVGVFALGLVTLFASQYILPERLFPLLSFVSGGIVLVIGLSLFIRRLRAALRYSTHGHEHHARTGDHAHHEHALQDHTHHDHTHDHAHDLAEGHSSLTHSHGGREHTHLPPGADGTPVTWRSLLALGISGGLLPCPSALVVMLSAISLHRVGYGLLLVVAFSIGLAATLMSIGLAFVYAGRLMKRPMGSGRLVRVLPVLSAFVIACIGAVVCYEALSQTGMNLFAGLVRESAGAGGEPSFASMSAFAILGLGLVFGLKHATEVDHVVAVSTIVSEHRNILRAALVGGLWGAGHTASLVIVGAIVLMVRIAIPETVASWLEFGVALMIIGLGASALIRALRKRADVHLHRHHHDGLQPHAHVHFHDEGSEHAEPSAQHSHAVSRVGLKPLIVGAAHGLAGSATLTLLVLTQIDSALLGLLYLAVFGLGSICGMLLMSGLIGLPFALSSRKLTGVHYGLQTIAGVFSIAFGFWYAYETGIANGLMTMLR